jgi:hypothetical protein
MKVDLHPMQPNRAAGARRAGGSRVGDSLAGDSLAGDSLGSRDSPPGQAATRRRPASLSRTAPGHRTRGFLTAFPPISHHLAWGDRSRAGCQLKPLHIVIFALYLEGHCVDRIIAPWRSSMLVQRRFKLSALLLAGLLLAVAAWRPAAADQAVSSQPLPAQGTTQGAGQGSGAPMNGAQAGNLHICNADEITSWPDLQSDAAYDCINAQNGNYDETPKALMCGSNEKAFCCTQKVDQLGVCKPIIGGKKRSTPIHEPTVPKGEPGSMETVPMDSLPAQQ